MASPKKAKHRTRRKNGKKNDGNIRRNVLRSDTIPGISADFMRCGGLLLHGFQDFLLQQPDRLGFGQYRKPDAGFE